MIGRLFAPLGMKIAAGIGLVMLLVISVQTWRLGNAKEQIEDQRDTIAQLRAEAEVQNAAIEAANREAERTRRDFERARGEGVRVITRYRDAARSIGDTPASGCPTPQSVLEAPL